METTSIPHYNVQSDFAVDLDAAVKSKSHSSSFWLSLYNYDSIKSQHTKVNCFSGHIEVVEPPKLQATLVNEKSFALTNKDNSKTVIQSPFKTAKVDASVNDVCLSPSNSLLFVGCNNGHATVLDGNDLSRRILLRGIIGDVLIARFFPSGKVVLTAGQDMTLKVWNLEDIDSIAADGPTISKPAKEIVGHRGTILDAAMIDRGRNIVSCAKDGSIRLWEIGSGTCLWDISPNANLAQIAKVNSVTIGSHDLPTTVPHVQDPLEFGTDGRIIVAGCDNGLVSVYDIRSRTEVFSYKSKTSSNVTATSILSSKGLIGAGMENGFIEVLDMKTQKLIESFQRNDAGINRLSFLETQGQKGYEFLFTNEEGSCPLIGFDNAGRPSVRIEFAGVDVEPLTAVHFVPGYGGITAYTGGRDGIVRGYKVNASAFSE